VDTAGARFAGEMIDLGLAALSASPFDGELLPGTHRDGVTRREVFLQKYKNSGAQGVLFYRQKFCDPHGFDIADVSDLCRSEGIPYLTLELDLQSDTGRISTRIEAFLEMLV
jgi:benzoyl-CoA reductase/2-hydroxyglutaryl-CoA dehydratase subunit BcrC/BadD/HgdB